MKKKFLTFILSICLVIPALFIVSACSDIKNDKVKMRVEDDCIQWSINDSDWENLITVDEVLDGAGPQDVNGKQVEFNITSTHIQWRYVGTDAWCDLVALEDVTDDDNAEDEEVVGYTVTYDYNTTLNLEELMSNYKTSESIEHNKAILNMPSLDNEDFDGYFLGWYIKGTEEKIENNDVIDENVTLEARWNNKFYINCSMKEVINGGYIFEIDATKSIVIVPEVYNDGTNGEKNVVKITPSVANEQKYLEQVVLPSTLKEIDGNTFSGCISLSSIEIPDSVTSIGDAAFSVCISLSEIVIPASLESIGSTPFPGCTSLESIIVDSNNAVYDSRENCNAIIETNSNTLKYGCKTTKIPDSVTTIGEFAFWGCTSLNSIEIPSSVTTIDSLAFSHCTSLSEIVIGASVESIGYHAFSGCISLESIIVDSNNTVYDSRENCNAIIETNSNTLVYGCKTTKIPASVESIGSMAFYDCTSLSSIEIPSSVTTIDSVAFWGCTSLSEIVIGASVESIGSMAFYDCTSLSEIVIPASVTTIGEFAFSGCTSLSSIEIPSSVKSIGSSAFSCCASLESIIVDSNNAVYDSRENCNAIIETNSNTLVYGCKTTKIPNNVTSIGVDAFYNCTSLSSIEIPSSVTIIKSLAFWGCTSLSEIVIPSSVEGIGSYAFSNCTSLSEIVIPSSVERIGSSAFSGCARLTSIIIDSSVIANGIIDRDSMGALVYNAVNIYIKTGLDTAQSTYLLDNYTKQATTDKTGYDKWVRNA